MPSCYWPIIALVLSAATGAAVARAFGRILRSGRPSPPAVAPGQGAALPTPFPTQPEGRVEPPSRRRQGGPGMEIRLNLPADAGPQVRVTVESLPTRGHSTLLYRGILPVEDPKVASPARLQGLRGAWGAITAAWTRGRLGTIPAPVSLEVALATGAAVLYMITRLWAIDSFPVFFYSDEANNVWFGEQSIQSGLLGTDGSWPAIYFEWDTNRWTPALSVYVHGLVAAVLGKSVFIARTTGAFITLAGVLAIAAILRDHFRSRAWWASILLAAGIPTWFLYSRTVFDTVAATALYAVFLYAYLQYRYRSPRYLALAALAGAAAFYAYSNMQAVVAALTISLLLIDFRYHVANRREWLRATPLLLLLSVPLVQFRLFHPGAYAEHMRAIGSYWLENSPWPAKLGRYAVTYLQGLNPVFWFSPQSAGSQILPNQAIPGAGHLGIVMLPLVTLGLIVAVRNVRSAAHRVILLSLVLVPVGSAVDSMEITRVLAMVVPALVLATLGLDVLESQLSPTLRRAWPYSVALVLAALAILRLHGALRYGPTWTTDYGLGGVQFGAKAVFEDTIPELLAQDPQSIVVMTTTWANNVHEYPRFFLSEDEQKRVTFSNVGDYLTSRLDLTPTMIIAMTPSEYDRAIASPLLASTDVVRTVMSPDGEPAFYFAHLAYAADADRIFEQERAAQQQPVLDTVEIGGQKVQILHSRLGDGSPANLFDGLTESLVRGDRANPFQVELRFPHAIMLAHLDLTVGSMGDFSVDLELSASPDAEPSLFSQRFKDLPADPTVTFDLGEAGLEVRILRLRITDNAVHRDAQIHVREIGLRAP